MDKLLAFLMAAFFLWAGIICVNRPRRVVEFIVDYFSRATGNPDLLASWRDSTGAVFLVRFLGILALINFVLQLYVLSLPSPPEELSGQQMSAWSGMTTVYWLV